MPDAALEPERCIEHRFGADALNPPGAKLDAPGRIVPGPDGNGLGVDDGYIDTGESIRVVFDTPVFLLEYEVVRREDGPDVNALPGEHEYRVEVADGLQQRGWSGAYQDRNRLELRRVVTLEILPVDGDRLAFGMLVFCPTSNWTNLSI
jgi:hypothetical protein